MEKEIIDVSGKKDIKIIRPGREVESYIENHAVLDVVTETERPCSDMDPFGLHTLLDCLNCSNCDYQIILKGKLVKEFEDKKRNQEQEKKTRYIIEFFERAPKQEKLLDYLKNEDSNYRTTRDSDGIILRPSLEDRRKIEEEQARIRADLEAMERNLFGPYLEESLKEEEVKSSAESPVKKKSIFSRILGTKRTQKIS